jgi:hypothetical protein
MGSSRSSRDSHIQLFLELRDDWESRGLNVALAPSSRTNASFSSDKSIATIRLAPAATAPRRGRPHRVRSPRRTIQLPPSPR